MMMMMMMTMRMKKNNARFSLLFLDIATDRQKLSFNGYKLEDAKILSYYGLGAGDIVDLQTKCTECDKSCDVTHNKLGVRKRRDITVKKTVFNNIPDFMAACGKNFFLDGKFPEGLEETHSKQFICQTYKNDLAYFATRFDTTRKTADFSAYKPNIGKLERVVWKNLYEHGTYISYMVSGAIIGDGDRKRAPFLLLGLAP